MLFITEHNEIYSHFIVFASTAPTPLFQSLKK